MDLHKQVLELVPAPFSVAVVGSVARNGGEITDSCDYMVMAPQQQVEDVLQSIASRPQTKRNDDAVSLQIDGIVVTIAVRSDWQDTISALNIPTLAIAGERCGWAPGYRFPEAVCCDILNAITIRDDSGQLSILKSQLTPYPHTIRTNISEWCTQEALLKIHALRRNRDVMQSGLFQADLSCCTFRLAFAWQEVFPAGFGTKFVHLLKQENPLQSYLSETAGMLTYQQCISESLEHKIMEVNNAILMA